MRLDVTNERENIIAIYVYRHRHWNGVDINLRLSAIDYSSHRSLEQGAAVPAIGTCVVMADWNA